jgi:hypothetical protein
MQNKYVGDESDFVKYCLLKNLCNKNLRLGINWCLVKDEDNSDGRRTSYLNNKKLHLLESELLQCLEVINKDSDKSINSIHQSKIFPLGTRYFSETIPFETARFEWHTLSLNSLKECDVIYYDPDNGLEIKSVGKLHPKSIKYVFYDEIRDTYQTGKSIVIYQHNNRSKNLKCQIEERLKELRGCLPVSKSQISVVSSNMGTGRYFLIIKQKDHSEILNMNLDKLERLFLQKYC